MTKSELRRRALKNGIRVPMNNTVASRGGMTSRRWYGQTRDVEILSLSNPLSPGVAMSFSIPSKGGGITEISVKVESKDFQTVIEALIAADRRVALAAIGRELGHELALGLK